MLTCYVFVFKSLKEKGHSKMRDYITYASLIIGIVMVVSIATGTDYNNYEWLKLGSRGWFYAGNELGSILAIMCPIVILYSIEKTKKYEQNILLGSFYFSCFFIICSWYEGWYRSNLCNNGYCSCYVLYSSLYAKVKKERKIYIY